MARRLARAVMVACVVSTAQGGGAYPEGIFPTSTKLTMDTYNDWIQSTIDSGKTAMVRWIASEG